MKREFLKELKLEDEIIEKIMTEHGKSVGDFKAKEGEIETLKTENKGLKETVKKHEKQLDGLKDIDADGLKATIEQLKSENKTAQKQHDDDLKALKVSHAVDAKLAGVQAKNLKAVKALIDMDKVSLDGENLIGFDDQLKALTDGEETKFMFGEKEKTEIDGAKPAEGKDDNPGDAKTELERAQKAFDDKPTFDNGVALSRAKINSQNKEGE